MFDAEIQAAIDRQLEIERKARAWDELMRTKYDEIDAVRVLELDQWIVHPAQTPSTS